MTNGNTNAKRQKAKKTIARVVAETKRQESSRSSRSAKPGYDRHLRHLTSQKGQA